MDLFNRLEGWKEIARMVGRSDRWCRMMASRADEWRLPVWYLGDIPCITFDEIRDYIAKWRDATACQVERYGRRARRGLTVPGERG